MKRGGPVQGLYVFVLLAAFAVLALAAVVTGATVYRGIADRAESDSDLRTGAAYIAGKVRAHDRTGCIEVLTEDGVQVLALYQETDGVRYRTNLYGYDGSIREYYQRDGQPFRAENGERISDADTLGFLLEDGVLTVTFGSGDEAQTLTLALRAEVDG